MWVRETPTQKLLQSIPDQKIESTRFDGAPLLSFRFAISRALVTVAEANNAQFWLGYESSDPYRSLQVLLIFLSHGGLLSGHGARAKRGASDRFGSRGRQGCRGNDVFLASL